MSRLLTTADKDLLLKVLVESARVGEYYQNCNYAKLLEETGLADYELNALLSQFDRKGLVQYSGSIHYRHKVFNFTLNQEAIDFKLRGGFIVEEQIFEIQLKNLLQEIEILKVSNPLTDFANVTTIASGLIAAAKIYFNAP